MLIIERDTSEWRLPADPGKTVLDVLRAQGTAIPAPCGGHRRCGQCRVQVIAGEFPPPDAQEVGLLGQAALVQGLRLACCLPATAGTLRLPGTARPAVLTQVSLPAARSLSPHRHDASWAIAVDIGTTTVAMYLVDRSNRVIEGVQSALNAQKPYGDDVITRMQYVLEHGEEGRDRLAQVIRDQLGCMAQAVCAGAGVPPQGVQAAMVTGNTVMMHLLLGLPVDTLARAPFVPAALTFDDLPAREVGLMLGPDALCGFVPCSAAYVGGDIVSGALVVGLQREQGQGNTALFIDIGTNGEMVLTHEGRLLCCATAAGPAFEGAHITCGVGGVSGAICRCATNRDGTLEVATIDDAPPIGLCGSGLLDAVAALVEQGVIDETGYMEDDVVPIAGPVSLHAKDVREVQLAKAAISAGVATLLHHGGCTMQSVGRIYLAGGFGQALDHRSARKIGLIDPAFSGTIIGMGNAAAEGAISLLTGQLTPEQAISFAQEMTCVDLATDPCFHQHFIDDMLFPET